MVPKALPPARGLAVDEHVLEHHLAWPMIVVRRDQRYRRAAGKLRRLDDQHIAKSAAGAGECPPRSIPDEEIFVRVVPDGAAEGAVGSLRSRSRQRNAL